MAIFDRFKKEEAEAAAEKKAPKKSASSAKATDTSSKKEAAKSKETAKASTAQTNKTDKKTDAQVARYAGLLVKPHVSEKAAVLAEKNVYVFDVPLSANKIEIKKAVEAIYGVSVIAVRTQRGIGKAVKRGRIAGRRSTWKKALVEVKKGQTLNLIESV